MQFHTATINTWKHLLQDDSFKDIIISSLNWLYDNNRAIIHGFVIMPNHIHLIWTTFETGKQHSAQALASHTAHEFKKRITGCPESGKLLKPYNSTQADRDYHFWERRPKSVDIKDRNMAVQTLEYIHNNPLQEHWNLAEYQEDYKYSSASYYINGESEFKFLKHISDFL
jgi:REP element-mobilizing transposase RayT